jgi:hypothetical protein
VYIIDREEVISENYNPDEKKKFLSYGYRKRCASYTYIIALYLKMCGPNFSVETTMSCMIQLLVY